MPAPASTARGGCGCCCCMGASRGAYLLTAGPAECVLRGLALGCEGLDGVLGRYVGQGVVRAAHTGEAVPAALDGLIQALVIGGAEEIAMSLDRHLLVALQIYGRRPLGRERLRPKGHSNGPPCEARAYNRTRQPSPHWARASAAIWPASGNGARGRIVE